MSHYSLFLDECSPTSQMNYFVLGGCIIENESYDHIVTPHVNKLKRENWGNTDVILHEYDIRKANEGPYLVLRQASKRERFWVELRKIFSMDSVHTLGVAVDCDEYSRLYKSPYRNNEYLVALHLLLENFVHFLDGRNATGSVYVESRNDAEDRRLAHLYHRIKATGTLFFDCNIYQQKLGNIFFPTKSQNNVGLQLADFVPNPVSREHQGKKQKMPSIHQQIMASLYCGQVGLTPRFGLKKIP